MSSKEDILNKEIESWRGFEYALREENRILFHKMLNECSEKEYAKCMITKGENFSTESLFLTLIFQQHKMINELVAKLRDNKKDNR